MKHYKLVEFFPNVQRKAPLLKIFWQCFCSTDWQQCVSIAVEHIQPKAGQERVWNGVVVGISSSGT